VTASRPKAFVRRALGALLTASLLATFAAPATTLGSSTIRSFTARYQTTDRGSISLIGNTLLTCSASSTCTDARNGTGGTINNNDFSMVYVDVDSDAATFNSSTADLDLPAGATVLFAGLYWGAASSSADRDDVKFAVPGGSYQTVSAAQVDVTGSQYSAVADVTSLLTALADADGTYTVADVQALTGSNRAAGWSLVVVYQDDASPLRNLTVFDGYVQINTSAPSSITTTVSGFITPAAGTVNAEVGIVSVEGDLGLTGDQLLINGSNVANAANPSTNVFNSSISDLGSSVTTKSPNYLNQLGFDIDLIDGSSFIGNSDTSADLTFTTSGDVYYPSVLTFAVDVFQPQLDVPKSQSDVNGGSLAIGDEIEYTVEVTNIGNDTATGVVLTDAIPTGTTYVPGSLSIVSGSGAGALTDASLDDRGEYDAGNDRVVIRLGTGATALSGGSLAPAAATSISFRVSVDAGLSAGQLIENQARVSYSGLTLGGSYLDTSDGDDDAAGDQPTELAVNTSPTANDDAAATAEDTAVAIDILDNDTDPDDDIDPTTVTVTSGPANGSVSVNAVTGVVTYTPDADWSGTDTFTYEVCDSSDACDSATATVTVSGVNDAPIAADDTASVAEDGGPLTIDVTDNDSDVDGNLDPSTVSVLSGPTNGSVTVDPVSGEIDYTPDAGFNGTDTLTYQVCDTGGSCDIATVTVTVSPVADPPVAADDSFGPAEDTPTLLDVLANDSDVDGNLDPTTVSVTSGPSNGSVSVDPLTGEITFTPDADYNGPDSFTYEVCDDGSPQLCDSAIVSLVVGAINDTPVAEDDGETTDEDSAVDVDVLVNDADPDGPADLDPTSVTVVSGPSAGSVTIDPLTGVATYTPDANFNGSDSFIYEVCDLGTPALCDTATVTITVDPVNDGPVANDDSTSTAEDSDVVIDVVANDVDVESDLDPSSVTVTSGPADGSVSVDPVTGEVTYTPDPDFSGSDSFTYEVCDGGSPVLCDTATVTISTIIAIDDRPDAVDDSASVDEDDSVVVDVLANDSDPDGTGDLDPTTVTIVGGPSNGSVSVDPVTGEITYTPDPDFEGTDTFRYEVCDSIPLCDAATVTVTVNGVPDDPVAVDDTATTNEDTAVAIDILANDGDVDDDLDPTSVTIVSGPSNGTVTVDPVSGLLTYTPDPEFNGPDGLTYEVCDDRPVCVTAEVAITVQAVNDGPVVDDDAATTGEDTPVSIDVTANDSDVDGTIDPTTVSVTSGPSNGSVSVDPATGEVTYTPDPDFDGSDTFSYEVCDDGGECASATVTIDVAGANDAPTPANDRAATDEDEAVVIDVLANDDDPDGSSDLDPATVAVVSGPTHGTVTVDPATGEITYTPDPDYDGPDSFTYQICDVSGECSTATVSVGVAGVPDPPVGGKDTVTTKAGQAVTIDVLGNDTDADGDLDPSSVAIASAPAHGTVSVNSVTGEITYTPADGWTGPDTFAYTVCDTGGNCVTVEVLVITGLPDTFTVMLPNETPVFVPVWSVVLVVIAGFVAFAVALAQPRRRNAARRGGRTG
jgi:uncharacterized repeat protein (TIGR01451 family)